jgi:hypothetical protein
MMTSFGYSKKIKIKIKNLEFIWQYFGNQSSFWVKVNFDPITRWRGLDKINVHKIYNLHFLTTIRPHVCDSWNITK